MRLTDQRQSGESKMNSGLKIMLGVVVGCAIGFALWFAYFVVQAVRFFHG